MKSGALIIGLDGYATPLTSCVKDAQHFRDALIKLKLVKSAAAELLTLPQVPGAGLADAKTIRDRLYHCYANGSGFGRFFFYFAGHGIYANANASRSRAHSVFVPTECVDWRRDAALLWSFDELRETMERCGPQEQLYFIDACRDLHEDRNPEVGKLGFSGAVTTHARSQAMLFAVSPLGKALGVRDGLGVMTGHLLEALNGQSVAVEYDDDVEQFVISMQSLKRHAEHKIRALLEGEPNWRLRYSLPELRVFGGPASALVTIDPPPQIPLTVHIDPDHEAGDTSIRVLLRGEPINVAWPPLENHGNARLRPHKYRLVAGHRRLPIDPQTVSVDLRDCSDVHFRIRPGTEVGMPVEPPVPGAPNVVVAYKQGANANEPGTIKAAAAESTTTVELERQERPYMLVREYGRLDQRVPAGAYHIRFLLGDRVQSEGAFDVDPGSIVTVTPSLEASLLVHESAGTSGFVSDATFSESVGPMQSGVLQTLLTIIGIKHFDVGEQIFHQFRGVIAPVSPDDFSRRGLALVVALDGDGWPADRRSILEGIDVAISGKPHRLTSLSPGVTGFGRVGIALASCERGRVSVFLSSRQLGGVRLASTSLPDRATIVTVTFRPDGGCEVGQALLAFPDRPDPAVPSHLRNVPYGQFVRAIQLGQMLYRSDELVDHLIAQNDQLFLELMNAKWTDPILTTMAYFARRRVLGSGRLRDPTNSTVQLIETVANNLYQYFSELPDARVVHALAFPGLRTELFEALLADDAVPVLADAAVELAEYARANHLNRHFNVLSVVERIGPGQIWSMTRWEADVEQEQIWSGIRRDAAGEATTASDRTLEEAFQGAIEGAEPTEVHEGVAMAFEAEYELADDGNEPEPTPPRKRTRDDTAAG